VSRVQGPGSLRWWMLVFVVLGVGMRCWFVHLHAGVAGDSLLYGDLAQNMLSHHVYGFTEAGKIRPTLIRLPGYPLFLAACFAVFGAGNFVAAVWVQVVVDLWGCWLMARLAARLWGARVGVVALGLGMLCPFTANYCAVPLTESLVIFCVVLALYGLERWVSRGGGWNVWLWVIAFALVYGIFLRPDEVLLAVVVVVGILWVGWMGICGTHLSHEKARGEDGTPGIGGIKPVVGMYLVMALPFLFWGVRNWRVLHVVQPLAPRFANDPGEAVTYGFNRWYRTWAIDFEATVNVYWNWDGSPVKMSDLAPRAIDDAEQLMETRKLYAMYAQTGASTSSIDAGMMRLANERIAANPLRYYVEVPALKVVNMWLRPRTEFMNLPLDWWRFREHKRGSWECLGFAVWNAVYLVLACVGFWRWRRGGVLAAVMVGFVVLRCALLWTIDNSEPRYTLECFPVVILLAAVAFAKPGLKPVLSSNNSGA
jgi:hypothetical protein